MGGVQMPELIVGESYLTDHIYICGSGTGKRCETLISTHPHPRNTSHHCNEGQRSIALPVQGHIGSPHCAVLC